MLFFLVIGFFATVVFDQGQDIIKTLSLSGNSTVVRQTWFVYLAVSWWAWQSFRSARVTLHFSYFNFWQLQPGYALQAQVLIPRLLAIFPYLILSLAIYRAGKEMTGLIVLLLFSALALFVFLHLRKQIIVWIRGKKPFFEFFVPDYIPIKNGTYPASFIWNKQKSWVLFRVCLMAILVFALMQNPVELPQYLGSATIVLLGFGCWLIVATIIDFIQKIIKFPIAFSLVLMTLVFSFFNNNHAIRTIKNSSINRPDLETHFTQWLTPRLNKSDTTTVYLIMAEGGGLRSAYWTNSVLNKLADYNPQFKENTYAFSAVSGGSLGSVYQATNSKSKKNRGVFNKDLLAPVTSALIFSDLIQKFIPFPIKKLDRSRVLEKSFEDGIAQPETWQSGFLKNFANHHSPLLVLNATHVETGNRAIITNVRLNDLNKSHIIDLFDITQTDIPTSTAIGISSRFPFITPPALIQDKNGNSWGNLVDGGYYENLGLQTMLNVYQNLREICKRQHLNVKFRFVAIRNTKAFKTDKPLVGMAESLSPAITFTHIWGNNSDEVIENGRALIEANGDALYLLNLKRDDSENIPLGWYLSPEARHKIDQQTADISEARLKEILGG